MDSDTVVIDADGRESFDMNVFDVNLKYNTIYYGEMMKRYLPDDYEDDDAPDVLRGIFNVEQIFKHDNVRWLEYHYNNISREFNGTFCPKLPHTIVLSQVNMEGCHKLKNNRYVQYCTDNIIDVACHHGAINCVKWLYDKGRNFTINTVMQTLRRNNCDLLTFVLENGALMHRHCTAQACANNDLTALKLLLKYNCPIDYVSVINAAQSHSSNCLSYLLENGHKFCWEATEIVIDNDYDTMLEVAQQYGHRFGFCAKMYAKYKKADKCIELLKK